MSSRSRKIITNKDFVERFAEVCGSSEPAEVQRSLNISYQAAKNYLSGLRYPSTEILIIIAERTGCSIHWLLTGEGKKFVRDEQAKDTPPAAGQTEAFVRRVCVEVINERFGSQGQPKVVVLPPASLMEETPAEEEATHSEDAVIADLASARGRSDQRYDRIDKLDDDRS